MRLLERRLNARGGSVGQTPPYLREITATAWHARAGYWLRLGGLAYYMAKNYGVSVVGVTISAEQQKMAQDRCEGLDVTILLQDYRDLHDQFDRIVSVGMFEHVGPKNYDTYFSVTDRNLKPDGVFLLHTIGSKKQTIQLTHGSISTFSRMAVSLRSARLRKPASLFM